MRPFVCLLIPVILVVVFVASYYILSVICLLFFSISFSTSWFFFFGPYLSSFLPTILPIYYTMNAAKQKETEQPIHDVEDEDEFETTFTPVQKLEVIHNKGFFFCQILIQTLINIFCFFLFSGLWNICPRYKKTSRSWTLYCRICCLCSQKIT